MSRAKRIVLTVLILWTWLHLCLWSLNGFCLLSSWKGLWPFGGGTIIAHCLPPYKPPDSQPSIVLRMERYDAFEFTLYVGMPWTVFGVCHVANRKESE